MKKVKSSIIIFMIVLTASVLGMMCTPEYDLGKFNLNLDENKIFQHGIHEYVEIDNYSDSLFGKKDIVFRVDLQNVTKRDLDDVKAVLTLEAFDGDQEIFEKIFDLDAGEEDEITIAGEVSTKIRFIRKFELCIDGGDLFEPKDIEKVADEPVMRTVYAFLMVVAFLVVIINSIQLSKYSYVNKKKHAFGDPTIEKEHRYEETSEELKERLRIKKLELQQKYGHVKSTSSVKVTCEYCGMTNDYEKGRCSSCGARLRLK